MEKESWLGKMTAAPADLARESKAEFMKTLKNVAISSDAFFPFRDSIDHASPPRALADPACRGYTSESRGWLIRPF